MELNAVDLIVGVMPRQGASSLDRIPGILASEGCSNRRTVEEEGCPRKPTFEEEGCPRKPTFEEEGCSGHRTVEES